MDASRRSNKNRNEVVKERMREGETIITDIVRKQPVYYGHMYRISNERLSKKVMKWVPQERREKRRANKTWIEG